MIALRKNIEIENQTNLDSINKELDSSRKNNKTLSEQILDLDKRLTLKSEEVSKMTK